MIKESEEKCRGTQDNEANSIQEKTQLLKRTAKYLRNWVDENPLKQQTSSLAAPATTQCRKQLHNNMQQKHPADAV